MRLLVLLLAGCGRVGFESATNLSGTDPLQQETAPGDPPPDFSGDGVPDLAITHPSSEGLIHLFTGVATTAPDTANPTSEIEGSGECGPSGAARFANLRGLGESIVFAIRCSSDVGRAIRVGVMSAPVPAGVVSYNQFGRQFSTGTSAATLTELVVADLDGDGTLDLAAGQPSRDRVLIYFDLASRLLDGTVAEAELTGVTGEALGSSLAAVDATGDGVTDLVVGAPGSQRVLVVPGPLASGTASVDAVASTIVTGGVGFGSGLAVWDADADDTPELVVTQPDDGVVNVFRLPLSASPFATITSAAADRLGGRLDASGDVDGDGHRDLLLAALGAGGGAGALAIFTPESGFPSRTLDQAQILYTGEWAPSAWGGGAFVGDLDGDGKSDFAASAPGEANGLVTVHLTSDGLPARGAASAAARWVVPAVSFYNGFGRIVPRR